MKNSSTAAGDSIELEIVRLAQGGAGVGFFEGRAIFVPGTLGGERVRARITESRKRYAHAELVEVLESSSDRRELDCPHETGAGCGGCGFRHVRDEVSLARKTEAALGELVKLARGVSWPEPTLYATHPLDGQRRRVRFRWREGNLGLYQRGSHTLVPIPECRACHPDILLGVATIERVWRPLSGARWPNTVLVEVHAGATYAAAIGPSPIPKERLGAIEGLITEGALTGFVATAKGTRHELGDPWIEEVRDVEGSSLRFHRMAGGFAQACSQANHALQDVVYAHLAQRPAGRVLDLYAGAGNLSLIAASAGHEVLAVEVDESALRGLRRTIETNSGRALTAYRRDLQRGFTTRLREFGAHTIVLDPPRTGARELIGDLLQVRAETLVYVSCSPPHLARDVAELQSGYQVVALHAFDMFPRTAHLEMVAVLERSGA